MMDNINVINYININLDNSDDESCSIDMDSDFFQMGIQVAFPRAGKVVRERSDYKRYPDNEFLQKFRLTKTTVKFLTELIKNKISSPTTRNDATTPEQKVLLTLRYYATGSFEDAFAEFAGVHESTVEKIIKLVSEAIAELRPQFIYMPESDADITQIRQEFYNIAKFPRCIGALDCTHIKIRSPGGKEPEIFKNRNNYFSINVQTISDTKLRIQNIVARWPGSSLDSHILKCSRIRQHFESGKFKNNVLVADSGYGIQKYIITPLQDPKTAAEVLFNESQMVTRNPVERSHEEWKLRFPILSIGISVQLSTALAVIVATAVLHNIALKFGDDVPHPTRELEALIDIQEVENIPLLTAGNNRSVHRHSFLKYFESQL
ncbi:putative nuclease HARBI1 [Planococcus citri]|uniref:putative nuclease HARBI1 n=1 Tax=Planococcus citri TaxID=170843 RepID=UPI0031F7E0ED